MAHNDNRYPHGTNYATGLNHGGAAMFILVGALLMALGGLVSQGKIPWPF